MKHRRSRPENIDDRLVHYPFRPRMKGLALKQLKQLKVLALEQLGRSHGPRRLASEHLDLMRAIIHVRDARESLTSLTHRESLTSTLTYESWAACRCTCVKSPPLQVHPLNLMQCGCCRVPKGQRRHIGHVARPYYVSSCGVIEDSIHIDSLILCAQVCPSFVSVRVVTQPLLAESAQLSEVPLLILQSSLCGLGLVSS